MTCLKCPNPVTTLPHILAHVLCTEHLLEFVRAVAARDAKPVWPECLSCKGPMYLIDRPYAVCMSCVLRVGMAGHERQEPTVDVTTEALPVRIERGARPETEPKPCEKAPCPPKMVPYRRAAGAILCQHHYEEREI